MSRLTRFRRGAAMVAAAAVTSAGLTAMVSAPAHAAEIQVDDAQFVWGVNNESNNSAFAPGTFNFFSAGKIGDPGEGGQTLTDASQGASWLNGAPAGWAATSGNVTIQKEQADGSYGTATWAGTRTSPTGGSINPPTSQVFSDHQIVIDEGTGTVDPEANTAEITWDGDFTIVFYSGLSFFYVSDPVLTVNADGTGEITATGTGFAADQFDPELWEPIAATEITLADLTGVEITDEGFITTPDYLGVSYDAGANGTPQAAKTSANEAFWGSFPQSFVDFAAKTGGGPYWYSSGGSVDRNKPTLPIEVSYSATPAPAPAVTVSQTVANADGTTTVTIEGTGFNPALATGTRPPLLNKAAGTYIAFGKFAENWKASNGATTAARATLPALTKWAVPADSIGTVGGPNAGAVELEADGTFTAQITLDKPALDVEIDKRTNKADLVNYGIYTYPGSGAVQPLYETYTPISFDGTDPEVTLTGPASITEGASAEFTVAANDDESGVASVEYSVDGSEWAAVTGTTFTLSGLTVGTYDVAVRATNGVGRTGTDTATLEVTEAPVEPIAFTDTVGNTFSNEIAWLSTQGITTGYDNGNGTFSFRPSDAVLREQMAAFLYRFENDGANPPSDAPNATFTDSVGNTFSKHIAWLAQRGITTGYADNTFRPSAPVLREQMAAFLYRLAGSPIVVLPETSPFADIPTTHTFYKQIVWLASTNITTGYVEPNGSKTFKGSQPVLREQMAAFLFRYNNLPQG